MSSDMSVNDVSKGPHRASFIQKRPNNNHKQYISINKHWSKKTNTCRINEWCWEWKVVGGWRGKSRKQFVHTYIHTDNIETNMKNKTNKAVLREEGCQRKKQKQDSRTPTTIRTEIEFGWIVVFFYGFRSLAPLGFKSVWDLQTHKCMIIQIIYLKQARSGACKNGKSLTIWI